jgi:hypothetical protein
MFSTLFIKTLKERINLTHFHRYQIALIAWSLDNYSLTSEEQDSFFSCILLDWAMLLHPIHLLKLLPVAELDTKHICKHVHRSFHSTDLRFHYHQIIHHRDHQLRLLPNCHSHRWSLEEAQRIR